MRFARTLPAIFLLLPFVACGGGSGSRNTTPPNNIQAINVNAGPAGNYVNGVFTSVTVCAPGSSNCQSIGGVLVDTGSFGLRVLSSALTVPLKQQNDSSGRPVVECAQFALGITWGPVQTADVKIAGEVASSIPVQVIGDPDFSSVPTGCSSQGAPQQDLSSLGANGILGIGNFIADCGPACQPGTSNNPNFYYACTASTCQVITLAQNQQVQNPVAAFLSDSNGILIDLPSTGNAPSLSGNLVFGIGTQNNNSLGNAQVLAVDGSGNISTDFESQTNIPSFLDSGSNGYFFLDSNATGITTCPKPNDGFYCPSSPINLSATNKGTNNASNTVNFTIDNANSLFSNASDNVFPTLGGPNAGVFDWGLPFFYGQKVYVAIENRNTPGGTGPFIAY